MFTNRSRNTKVVFVYVSYSKVTLINFVNREYEKVMTVTNTVLCFFFSLPYDLCYPRVTNKSYGSMSFVFENWI